MTHTLSLTHTNKHTHTHTHTHTHQSAYQALKTFISNWAPEPELFFLCEGGDNLRGIKARDSSKDDCFHDCFGWVYVERLSLGWRLECLG